MFKYFLIFFSSCLLQSNTLAPLGKPCMITYDANQLRRNKVDIKNGNENKLIAYKQLIKEADKAMDYKAVTVMSKTNVPPSGDKHDYMSLAPYFWPDSTKPDGLPYIRKDGQTNPEVKDYKDKDDMPKMCRNVETLALAYYFSDDDKYAQHAAYLIKTWFLNADTKMNPNLNYAQAIKGRNDGRGAGIIDSRQFIKIVDAAVLINTSPAWKKKDDTALKQWFADFLKWMETSKNGLDEMATKNNHGVWYDAQRIAFAAYVGDEDKVKEIAKSAANRMDNQMNGAGLFPKELERTISLHYSAFVMDAFFIIAQVAENNDIKFYHIKTPSGKSLQMAFEAHKKFFTGDEKWTGQQIKKFDPEEGYMILMEGWKKYNCKDCNKAVANLEGEKAARHRTNLLY